MPRSTRPAIAMADAAAFGATLLILTFAPHANAACSQWDISGKWNVAQTNGPHTSFEIEQDGHDLRGTGWTANLTGNLATMAGSLDGSIDRDDFEFTVYWSPDVIGVYKGSVNSRGRLDGTTYDRMNPKSTALWHSQNTGGRCADAAASQPAPTQAPAPKPKTVDEKLQQGVKKIPKQFGTSP